MVCAIEDVGFDIRDQIGWISGSGMPKSHHSLKPSWEPIVLARKPLIGSVATNIAAYGCGGLNIDPCRIPIDALVDDPRLGGKGEWSTASMGTNVYGKFAGAQTGSSELGRWPANIITDNSDEVLASFAQYGTKTSGKPGIRRKPHETNSMSGRLAMTGQPEAGIGDSGSAARFFQACPFTENEEYLRFHYSGKATKADRAGSSHPTIKPISLMRYLCKLITPAGGTVLDLFAGSGTTGEAAVLEGFNAILIEREDEYAADIRNRLALFLNN
jgi:site-specific DNA-methyltransferase (adenine-specific)